jgi:3-phosphoshikimate 1-carboxyvinyltransferase
MRLLAGLLAAQSFDSVLTGEPQLLRRPMRRVTKPLRAMNAVIGDDDGRAPLRIHGQSLQGMRHVLPVASAQVKSALLLAGLYAAGPTTVVQPGPSRDHTERMLAAMGTRIRIQELAVTLQPAEALHPLSFSIPGDFSSAAFLMAAAVTIPGAQLTIRGVGINPTRTGLLDVLRAMDADITLRNLRFPGDEPVADLEVHQAPLRGVQVDGDTVVRMIDEFPVLAVVATQAQGETVVREAAELRVKETDRIATVVAELNRMGADMEARPDGFVVRGPTPLHGTTVESHGDHRLAMALAVAGLLADGETVIQDAESAADSFPGFWQLLRGVLLT